MSRSVHATPLPVAMLLTLLVTILCSCSDDDPTGPDVDPNAPIIDSIVPADGTIGDTVVVYGSRFSMVPDSNIVVFGRGSSRPFAGDHIELQVVVPPGATTDKPVVRSGARTGMAGQDFTVYWKLVAAPAASRLHDIIYTDSRFVIFGNEGLTMSSADGTGWSNHSSGTSPFYTAVAGQGRIVAAQGTSGVRAFELEGPLDQSVNFGVASSGGYLLAASNAIFVAAPRQGGEIRYSADGVIWTTAALNPALPLSAVVYTDHFVAYSEGADIWTSSDGVTWSHTYCNLIAPAPSAFAWTGTLLMATKPSTLYYSFNGSNFIDGTPGAYENEGFSHVEWTGEVILVQAGDGLIWSEGAVQWRRHALFPVTPTSPPKIACSDTVCIAVGGFYGLLAWRQ
ncbi:IPT/TIG domain-containing protein [bacterium]|nr:IPT/TIG domain-containing protein [bacterium]